MRLQTEGMFSIGFDAEYRYFCKDHLGSVRKVLRYDDDWSGAYTEYQSNKYSPFGGLEFEDNLAENKTLFTGKELQDSRVGNDILRLYDFGARYYDPTVARWTSIDPFAEMYYSRSPYNYALNNPINLIDPNGLFAQGPTIGEFPNLIFLKEYIVGSRTHSPLVENKTSPFNYSSGSGYLSHSYNSPYGTAGFVLNIHVLNGPKGVPMYLLESLPTNREMPMFGLGKATDFITSPETSAILAAASLGTDMLGAGNTVPGYGIKGAGALNFAATAANATIQTLNGNFDIMQWGDVAASRAVMSLNPVIFGLGATWILSRAAEPYVDMAARWTGKQIVKGYNGVNNAINGLRYPPLYIDTYGNPVWDGYTDREWMQYQMMLWQDDNR